MFHTPAQFTATEALARLKSGELSVVELARSCLARFAVREPQVQAWAYLDEQQVLQEAERLDALSERGPLHGLPIGIKDVFQTQDMPTQYNSPIYEHLQTGVDAAAVKLLRSAGALIFGKTTTVEFAATGRHPPTRNPHHLERTPGGSSSGSAAAVADFHVPLALATQTGGSTIRPASFCGIYGMKPTWNRISMEGAKTFAPSLDTLGWHARSAADLALLYQVLMPAPITLPEFDLSNARIGVCRSLAWPDATPATQMALTQTSQWLRESGAQVIDLSLPASFDDALLLQTRIMRREGGVSFLPEYRQHRELLHADLQAMVHEAARADPSELLAAHDQAARCRAEFDVLATHVDVIVTPSATGEAPQAISSTGKASTGHWTFNAMWTLLHTPCVNVPGCVGPTELPVGLTLTGPRCSDLRVLAAAESIGKLLATHMLQP